MHFLNPQEKILRSFRLAKKIFFMGGGLSRLLVSSLRIKYNQFRKSTQDLCPIYALLISIVSIFTLQP